MLSGRPDNATAGPVKELLLRAGNRIGAGYRVDGSALWGRSPRLLRGSCPDRLRYPWRERAAYLHAGIRPVVSHLEAMGR